MIEALYGELGPADKERFDRHLRLPARIAPPNIPRCGRPSRLMDQREPARPRPGILGRLLGPAVAPDALGGDRRGPAPVPRRPAGRRLSAGSLAGPPGRRSGRPPARRHPYRQPPHHARRRTGPARPRPSPLRAPGPSSRPRISSSAPRSCSSAWSTTTRERGRLRPGPRPEEDDVAGPGRRGAGAPPAPSRPAARRDCATSSPTSRSS